MNISQRLVFLSEKRKKSQGFTLIELLIVIAVIGVLAAVVITVLNPLEQLAKSRDVGRTNSVSQLGKAIELYFLANNAYPLATNWQHYLMPGTTGTITGTGDIKQQVTVPAISTSLCTVVAMGNVCYSTDGTNAAVWTPLESSSEKKLAGCASGTIPIVAWLSYRGQTGLTCTANLGVAPSLTATLN
ncbi:MAG: prepilin-type N-terminal cleavage/methylation domain-containing protein [Candidatus Levybacteria bacterium]|nr:prepilin-type N-terminal cleavage/methylation domain-containing protein [Candidatus Levybacteria bacterium]